MQMKNVASSEITICGMEWERAEALGQFFSAQKRLNKPGVVDSRDYVGDTRLTYIAQGAGHLDSFWF